MRCIQVGLLLALAAILEGCGGGGTGGLEPPISEPRIPIPQVPEPPLPPDPPTSVAASVVVGQSDFVTGSVNRAQPRPSADSLSNPFGGVAVLPDGRLAVPDYGNHRVLVFDAPLSTGSEASVVLGQRGDFTSANFEVAQGTHPGADFIAVGPDRVAVVDYDANRVSVYNSANLDPVPLPEFVVGQDNFTAFDLGCSQSELNVPESAAWLPDGRLLVVDGGNHRVLLFDNVWDGSRKQATLVLGQQDFDHCVENDQDGDGKSESTPSASTMKYPSGVWTDGTRLVVVDGGNNRVLIWKNFPGTNGLAAEVVLGQPDFGTAAPAVPASRFSLSNPYKGVDFDEETFAIADSGNNRVLIWNGFPSSNQQGADGVIGQPGFSYVAANDSDEDGQEGPGPTATTLSQPAGLKFHQGKLYVADSRNHRLLVFDRTEAQRLAR